MDTITVGQDQVGRRLDAYIASVRPEYSRSIWKSLIEDGKVLVDNNVAAGSQKLNFGQKVQILEIAPIKQEDLPVIYEDDKVIVINKPAGVLTHLKNDFVSEPTVAGFIAAKTTAIGGNRAGIVHRLDRATSGVLIAAKNDKTRVFLTKQFANRRVEKWYLAVVKGNLAEEFTVIDQPIGRSRSKPSTFKIDPMGKPAQTEVYCLDSQKDHSLVLLRPHTGRTHQLRVHLKHIGHPIIGDPIYSSKKDIRQTSDMLLHAWQLKITIPGNNRLHFIAELPESMSKYLTDECRDKANVIIASAQPNKT